MKKSKFLIVTACVSALTLAACGGSKEKDILEESQEKMKALKSVQVEEETSNTSSWGSSKSASVSKFVLDPFASHTVMKTEESYEGMEDDEDADAGPQESEQYVTADGKMYDRGMLGEEDGWEMMDFSEELEGNDKDDRDMYASSYVNKLAAFIKFIDDVQYEEEDGFHVFTLDSGDEALLEFAKAVPETGLNFDEDAVGDMDKEHVEAMKKMIENTKLSESNATLYINKETKMLEKVNFTLRMERSMDGMTDKSALKKKIKLSQFDEIDSIEVPKEVVDGAKEYDPNAWVEDELKEAEEILQSDDLEDEERRMWERQKETYEAMLTFDGEWGTEQDIEMVEKFLKDENLTEEERKYLEEEKKMYEEMLKEESEDEKDTKDE
ncbi:DUF6612 family protein [Shouchella lonarensis]|nr:DUF6612 family protein [Shouchella lonarensis]